VKYLIESQIKINVRAYDDIVFVKTCENGHLGVAEYLLRQYPDICERIIKDKPFRQNLYNKNFESIKYLINGVGILKEALNKSELFIHKTS
jgi:hypothetical protein